MAEVPLARPSSSDVDLHWRLSKWQVEVPFDFDTALQSAVRVDIGTASVPTLSPDHALIHMALHARKEAWPFMRSVVDIVWLAGTMDDDHLRSVAHDHRTVRIALGVAAHIDPRLTSLLTLSRADARLVANAWDRCLSGQSWTLTARHTHGWRATRLWLDHNWWLWRSAPSWTVRWAQVRRWVVRSRVVFDRRYQPWRVTPPQAPPTSSAPKSSPHTA